VKLRWGPLPGGKFAWQAAAGRGRPPEAAARRAGLEFVEKLLPANLTSTDTAERNAGVGSVPLVASLVNWESPRYSKPGNAGYSSSARLHQAVCCWM
jgi:hypothetical protein